MSKQKQPVPCECGHKTPSPLGTLDGKEYWVHCSQCGWATPIAKTRGGALRSWAVMMKHRRETSLEYGQNK